MGNKIEYISKQEYHDQKINNDQIILFPEDSYMVQKCDINTKTIIETFDSMEDANFNIGYKSRSSFGRIVNQLTENQSLQDYIHSHKNFLIPTHLKYHELIFREFFWKVIYGRIKIFEKDTIKRNCDKLEHDYIKMSEDYI